MDITQIVTDLGFPIFGILACGYFINNLIQNQRLDNLRREERMYNQLNKFGENMDNISLTLVRLLEAQKEIHERLHNIEKEKEV